MPGKITLGRKLPVAAIGVAVFSGLLVFGFVNAPLLRAQSAQATSAPLPSFEVASIKPNRSGGNTVRIMFPPGRFTATNVTTKFLIQFAYNVKHYEVSGGPSWINTARYDIYAKLQDSLVDKGQRLTSLQRQNLIRSMLQSLLADRFRLTLKYETKQLPVYVLVLAKNGPKLREAKPSDTYARGFQGSDSGGAGLWMRGRGSLAGKGVHIANLVELLSGQLDRSTLDKTGLTGIYDFSLQWTPDENQPFMGIDSNPILTPQVVSPPDSSAASIFTAMQEQLGLKLESQNVPMETIVIDHIEQPSEN
jgi:uncharacterized protein (TIGR03435 family)